MTPFKKGGGRRRSFSSEVDEMDAESFQSVDSPPSPKSAWGGGGGAKNRLFDGDDDDDDDDDNFSFTLQVEESNKTSNNAHSKTPTRRSSNNSFGKNKKILKPVDLNLSLEDEDDEDIQDNEQTTTTNSQQQQQALYNRNGNLFSSSTSQMTQRQKKLQQKFAGKGTPVRSYYGDSADSSMSSSPYISPSSYITMDGRCVTSKNPFSPMITEDSRTATLPSTSAAPPLPVSFDTYGSASGGAGNNMTGAGMVGGGVPPPICRHRLQKREGTPTKRSFLYNSFTRDGYPERQGRYSFTGSPIKEDEVMMPPTASSPTLTAAAHKIRRLGIQDDVHHYPGGGNSSRRNSNSSQLMIDTQSEASSSSTASASFEEISPTDIMSFPAPPTPTKGKRAASNTNPYPRASNPPETPFLSRSQRRPRRRQEFGGGGGRHDFDDNSSFTSEDDSSSATTKAAPSRFKSDFDIISELGKGSFGAVYKVLSRLDGCCYAVKTALRKVKGNADRDRMLKEVYALAALSDQADPATFHIVRYHQAWMEDDRLYIQTELCSSNLANEIASTGGRLSVERRYKLLREMLLALEFLHRSNNGMCHLDIKPENIFVKKEPDVFKLGDFGLVAKLDFHRDVEEGDSRYMSMELLSGDHQDLTKSDIFSLGATLYEISIGSPLPMNGEEWQAIRAGQLKSLPDSDTPVEMEMLIRECMHPNYSNRPSAAELLKRPQLLSKEQKLLMSERNKVFQAKLALAQQAQTMKRGPPPPSAGGLVRRNTWSGGYF